MKLWSCYPIVLCVYTGLLGGLLGEIGQKVGKRDKALDASRRSKYGRMFDLDVKVVRADK